MEGHHRTKRDAGVFTIWQRRQAILSQNYSHQTGDFPRSCILSGLSSPTCSFCCSGRKPRLVHGYLGVDWRWEFFQGRPSIISLSPYLIELALFSGWVYPKIVSGSNRIGKWSPCSHDKFLDLYPLRADSSLSLIFLTKLWRTWLGDNQGSFRLLPYSLTGVDRASLSVHSRYSCLYPSAATWFLSKSIWKRSEYHLEIVTLINHTRM